MKAALPFTPTIGTRLLCWFGIYIVGQLPLLIYSRKLQTWEWFAFPLGLAYPATILLNGIVNCLPKDAAEGFERLVPAGSSALILMGLSCCLYVGHLGTTLLVRRRGVFKVLIWILAGIVLFNLASCADFIRNPPE